MGKNKVQCSSETLAKVSSLKKQIFELKLAKSISGTYDKKKIKELKNQVRGLYSSNN